jgi:hypothetical protein
VWGSIYPTVCQPVDAGAGASDATKNNNNNSGPSSQGDKDGSKNGSKNGKTSGNNADSARSAQIYSPRVITVMARDVAGMPIANDPAIELAQAAASPTATTSTPCKPNEIAAHDTQGKTICIPGNQVMEMMKDLLKSPDMKNFLKSPADPHA